MKHITIQNFVLKMKFSSNAKTKKTREKENVSHQGVVAQSYRTVKQKKGTAQLNTTKEKLRKRRHPVCLQLIMSQDSLSRTRAQNGAFQTSALISIVLLFVFCAPVSCFVPLNTGLYYRQSSLCLSFDIDKEIEQRLADAKALLEKTKAKMEKEDAGEAGDNLPFFAVSKKSPASREGVIKSRDEDTGLIIADGEKMATLSEQEEWENKSLLEVFENEIDENEDVYSVESQRLASRDLAASVWDLRKKLGGDYQRIFDKKNRFIGEDN